MLAMVLVVDSMSRVSGSVGRVGSSNSSAFMSAVDFV